MTFPNTVTLLNVKNGSLGRGRSNWPNVGDKTNGKKDSNPSFIDEQILLSKLLSIMALMETRKKLHIITRQRDLWNKFQLNYIVLKKYCARPKMLQGKLQVLNNGKHEKKPGKVRTGKSKQEKMTHEEKETGQSHEHRGRCCFFQGRRM